MRWSRYQPLGQAANFSARERLPYAVFFLMIRRHSSRARRRVVAVQDSKVSATFPRSRLAVSETFPWIRRGAACRGTKVNGGWRCRSPGIDRTQVVRGATRLRSCRRVTAAAAAAVLRKSVGGRVERDRGRGVLADGGCQLARITALVARAVSPRDSSSFRPGRK